MNDAQREAEIFQGMEMRQKWGEKVDDNLRFLRRRLEEARAAAGAPMPSPAWNAACLAIRRKTWGEAIKLLRGRADVNPAWQTAINYLEANWPTAPAPTAATPATPDTPPQNADEAALRRAVAELQLAIHARSFALVDSDRVHWGTVIRVRLKDVLTSLAAIIPG